MKKKIKKEDFKIQYYVRYPDQKVGELFRMPFKKINTNILSTEDEWKTIYYFQKEYIPIFEEEYFLNGSNYTFFIPSFSKSLLKEKIQEFIHYIKIHKWIAGIRIGSHIKHNKHFFEIQVWSIISTENKDLIEKLKDIFEYKGKVHFQLFFPKPLPDHSELTFIHQRNKKVYLLRFDYVLTREMYLKNVWWEIFMLSYFKKYYRPNSNVIDIGGNVGTHTLLLSEIVSPGSKIYVFEPVYPDIIKMNVDENHLQDHVIIYGVGVGNKNETIKVPIYPRNCVRNFGRLSLIHHDTELTEYLSPSLLKKCQTKMTTIKVVTLDSKKLTNISIMKIDVEGMELQVLEGAMDTIQRERPVIFMEIWKRRRKETFSNPIFKKLLHDLHYKPINIGGYEGHDFLFIPS